MQVDPLNFYNKLKLLINYALAGDQTRAAKSEIRQFTTLLYKSGLEKQGHTCVNKLRSTTFCNVCLILCFSLIFLII